jgi:hypothetical protein
VNPGRLLVVPGIVGPIVVASPPAASSSTAGGAASVPAALLPAVAGLLSIAGHVLEELVELEQL